MNILLDYISRFFSNKAIDYGDFDHIFYANMYVDLQKIETKKKLYKHYIRYGRSEGRHANLRSAVVAAEQKFGQLPGDFKVEWYKALNPDLFHFGRDELKYIEHFLEFGRSEGRVYRLEDGHAHGLFVPVANFGAAVGGVPSLTSIALSPEDPWTGSFVVPDFIVFSAPWRDRQVTSRAEALEMFIADGARQLCPINNEMSFDPAFYRSQHGFSAEIPDDQIYLYWLKIGFAEGHAPNENLAFQPYLGRSTYPSDFDYLAYSKRVGLKKSDKLSSLRHLFDIGFPSSDFLVENIGRRNASFFIHLGQYYIVRKMYDVARRALLEAAQIDDKDTLVFHLLGDALRELGRLDEALENYRIAIALEEPSLWSFIHAVRLAADLGRFELAFAIALQAREKIESKQEFQGLISDLLERYFSVQAGAARNIFQSVAKLGGSDILRQQADNAMFDVLDVVEKQTRKLFSFPVSAMAHAEGHILIYGNDDLKQCTHYRIKQKIQQFEAAGIDVRFVSHHSIENYYNNLVGARAVIFYRIAAFPKNIHAILTARALGIKTYYEIDDLIFDYRYYPDSYASYENQISTDEYADLMWGVPLFRYAMTLCDVGIASTRPLLEHMVELVRERRCLLLPNGLDKVNAASIARGFSYRAPDKIVSIFYGSGTKAHNLDFTTLCEPALIRLLAEFDQVRLIVVGHLRLSDKLQQFRSKITLIPFVADIDEYWSLLLAASINISVLARSPMADCKSEIKWLEAAALGVPSVLSETALYEEVIKPEETGFVANSPDEWYEALRALIVDPALRRSVGSAARKAALTRYSLEAGAAIIRCEFEAPMRGGATPAERRPLRVLICNVFFAPQSIGGATRVVEANVRHFQSCPADLEVMIFCSDEGAATRRRLRFDSYGASNVVRLSTPLERDMDWRPFNEDNEAVFSELVDAYQPDLIHFHCVQRLTATIVEVALAKKIPYCITLHDGWWIGDDQFLVDANGFLRLPNEELFQPGATHYPLVQSAVRRIKLGALLASADARISVSKSFANIYRSAGIADIAVIENGIARQDFRSAQAVSGSLDSARPLRLAHIGGRSAHKGAVLIEALLRRSRFGNLTLLMIDGRLRGGERIETLWGDTHVTLCGPYPQDRITDLYDRFDVLLAPSTWPESYGLVSREALVCGKWVVASKMGAMGECVIEGKNGFLVDSMDPNALEAILTMLDNDHQRYKFQPTFESSGIRSVTEQGEELLSLYRAIVASRRSVASREETEALS